MLNIIEGKQDKPLKAVIYGPEGIGKSTLAAAFPNPLFIDTEGSTARMEVRRIEKPQSFTALVGTVEEIAGTPGICDTLVLDTADWAEQMCITEVCARYKKTGVEEFGYGKGYTYVSEEFIKLIAALDRVIASGRNVVVTAHAKMRKFEQPDEMGAYDRWEMKLSKQVAPLLKEWCDLLLFCNYKTIVVTTENKVNKAQGGKRVMYTAHTPCWDAKNRFGLAEELPLNFKAIESVVSKKSPSKGKKAVKSDAAAQDAGIPSPPSAALSPLTRGAEPPSPSSAEDTTASVEDDLTEDQKLQLEFIHRADRDKVDLYAIHAVARLRGKTTDEVPTFPLYPVPLCRWAMNNWDAVLAYIEKNAEQIDKMVKEIEDKEEQKRKAG